MDLLEILPSSKDELKPAFEAQLEAHKYSTTFIKYLLVIYYDWTAHKCWGDSEKIRDNFWSSENLHSGGKCKTDQTTEQSINERDKYNRHYWHSFCSPPQFPWYLHLHTENWFLLTLVTLPEGSFFVCLGSGDCSWPMHRASWKDSSINDRLQSMHKFSRFLAMQVRQLWGILHTAVKKRICERFGSWQQR